MASVSCSENVGPRTKLRNSCDACSIAKIKCTQERPECSYCAKRLKSCIYSASKRVKRSQRKAQHHEGREACTSSAAIPPASTVWESPLPADLDSSISYSSLPLIPNAESSSSQDSRPVTPHLGQEWPDFFATLRSSLRATPPTEAVSSAEWANLHPSSIDSFSLLDDSIFDLSTSFQPFEKNNVTGGKKLVSSPSTIFCNTGTMTNIAEIPSSLPGGDYTTHRHSLSTDSSVNPRLAPGNSRDISPSIHLDLGTRRASSTDPPTPRCICNSHILQLFGQLSINPSGAWITSGNGHTSSSENPTFQQVYGHIANITSEIGKILQCSCSNDPEDLILLSLVIFKIQAWYAAAANTALGGDPTSANQRISPTQASMWLSEADSEEADGKDEGEDQQRIFLQDLLSRLTGLQVLIGRLAQRLVSTEPELERNSNPSGRAPTHDQIVVPPISGSAMRILTSDLRRRLSSLSRAIAEKLRLG